MKLKSIIQFFAIMLLMHGVAFSADDEHDHDHSAHSDEPFYGHVGIRLHADHVSDAGEGYEEVNEI